MLRVAILGNYNPSTEQQTMKGGAQSACSYLVDALRVYPDLDLHVVSCDAPTRALQVERIGDVTIHRLPALGRSQLLTGFSDLGQQVKDRLAEIQPQVIHAQDLRMGAIACSIAPDTTILTVHGIVREEARYYESRRERFRALLRARWIENECFRKVKHVIAISPYVRRYYPNLSGRNIYDIPNAIDESYFDIQEGGEDDRLLYAGRIIPRKRVTDLIRAVDLVRRVRPNVTLHIAGDLSNRRYVKTLRSLVASLELGDHVQFLGQLDEQAVFDEFRRCRLLVLASAQETAPMVIAQAMAAGKTVIATAVGGVPDMIEHGQSGFLVSTGDTRGLADRIIEVLENNALADQLGQVGRANAEAEYRASAVAARTREAYYDLVPSVVRPSMRDHAAIV